MFKHVLGLYTKVLLYVMTAWSNNLWSKRIISVVLEDVVVAVVVAVVAVVAVVVTVVAVVFCFIEYE